MEEITSRFIQVTALLGMIFIGAGVLSIFVTRFHKYVSIFMGLGCVCWAICFLITGEYSDDGITNFIIFGGASITVWHLGRILIGNIIFRIKTNSTITGTQFLLKNILAPIVVGGVLYILTGSTNLTFISIPIVGIISASIGI